MTAKKKVLLWVALSILLLIIVLVTAGAILAARVIDKEVYKPEIQPDPKAMLMAASKSGKLWKSLHNTAPDSVQTMDFTEAEFNILLQNLVFPNAELPVAGFFMYLKDGVFHIYVSQEIPSTPFGKYVNLKISLNVSVQDGKETVSVVEAYAGTVKLPNDKVAEQIDQALDSQYRNTEQEEFVRKTVISMKAEKGHLVIRYKPYELVRWVDKNYYGNNGTFIKMMEK